MRDFMQGGVSKVGVNLNDHVGIPDHYYILNYTELPINTLMYD